MENTHPTIWLIRHANRENIHDKVQLSKTDCSITNEGYDATVKLANNLNRKTTNVDKIIVSPYRRTIETGLILASQNTNAVIEIDGLISEVVTPLNYDIQIDQPKLLKPYLESLNIKSLEDEKSIVERCEKFLNKMSEQKGKNIFVVTHASIIMMLLKIAFNCDDKFFDLKQDYFKEGIGDIMPNYCEYIKIHFDNGKWQKTYTPLIYR